MQKRILIAASVSGMTAVILGAFGAHSLRAVLSIDLLNIWEKGVQYQFYHALALLGCALYSLHYPSKQIRYAAICFVAGIVCFSGSLYLLALRDLIQIPLAIVGPVTPLGGFFFIGGWGCLLSASLDKIKKAP